MASKRRQRRRSCEGKVRHPSSAEARKAMLEVIGRRKHRGGLLQVYRCTFCGGYHWGHARGRQKGAW